MAYITISNSKKLIRKLDEVKLESILESVYKKDIYFFSKRESANLKGIRELFRNPENFSTEFYEPIEVKDTFRYLYPESQPSYHRDNTCQRLTSNFRNVEIPVCVQQMGEQEVIRFRNWYNSNSFDPDNSKDYVLKLQANFPCVGDINPKSIDYINSGSETKENYSLEELENKIDTILREASTYFKSNPELQSVIRRYQKWTFLAYVNGNIYNNETKLSSDELKAFLLNYEIRFKTPVKELLIEYYRVKFNPDLSFEGRLLEKLGFQRCRHCLKENGYVLFSTAPSQQNEIQHESTEDERVNALFSDT